MALYEYYCPQCKKKFESLQEVNRRLSALCPKCNTKSKLVPSIFSHYWFNPFTTDGEGFTSKSVRGEELAEMNQELRER